MVELSGEGTLRAGPRGLRMASGGASGSITLGGTAIGSAPATAAGSVTLGGGGVLIAGATATATIGAPPGGVLIATATGSVELGGLSAEQAVRAVEVAARALQIVDPDDPAVRLLTDSAQAAGIRLEPIPADERPTDDYEPVTRDELYEMHRLLVQALVTQPESGAAIRAEVLAWLTFMLQVAMFVAAILKG